MKIADIPTTHVYEFIGQNGSMGLTTGRRYPVVIKARPTLIDRLRWGKRCVIITWPVYCPYGSASTFSQNWQQVV